MALDAAQMLEMGNLLGAGGEAVGHADRALLLEDAGARQDRRLERHDVRPVIAQHLREPLLEVDEHRAVVVAGTLGAPWRIPGAEQWWRAAVREERPAYVVLRSSASRRMAQRPANKSSCAGARPLR